MFLIWNGLGFLVALIPFAMLVLADVVLGHERYASSPLYGSAALLIAAVVVYLLGVKLNDTAQKNGREMIDKATGQTVVLRKRHQLFFIDMQWWGIVIAILAVVMAFMPHTA